MQPAQQPEPAAGLPAPSPFVATDDDRIVVVGSGPVGVRFAESVAETVPERPVLLLGDEPFRPYDRVRLSAFVAREMVPDRLITSSRLEAYPQVEVLADRRVVRIDRERRTIEDERGESYRYQSLVLATGSRPRLPPIPGLELPHVYSFRDMRDAERLLARQVGSRSVVVIGGGLLGLEAARAMRRFGTRVTVVEHELRLMFHQLDAEAATLLRAHVEQLGIQVHLGESVQQIAGRYSPELVRLKSGLEIECDSVVLATGITPNVELARDAGLAIGRGIRVDDSMLTSDPSIYAIGECAEHRDQVYGLVGPGLEQAGVAASHIAGRSSNYRGSIVATSLKVVGCSVFSMGEVVDSARPFRVQVFRSDNAYRRINVYRGRIIGAVGFGDWDVTRLRAVGLETRRLWPWQLWRFRRNGSLWPAPGANEVAGWPSTATVCTCRGVTRQTLEQAIAAGATCIDTLASATGASTVCGSCKPLLGWLIGAGARPRVPKTLLSVSSVSLALAAAALIGSVPYADSMSPDWRMDDLWTSSLAKQISGYSLLAIAIAVSLLSFRKRVRWFDFAKFSSWQIAHVSIGFAAVFVLLAHTGFRAGANLNAWLMLSFTGLICAGGLAGTAMALAQRYDGDRVRQLKSVSLWAHILLLWPLPALLGFHVLKGYYF
jgi:nitrite reductase (NADH) large subunit